MLMISQKSVLWKLKVKYKALPAESVESVEFKQCVWKKVCTLN